MTTTRPPSGAAVFQPTVTTALAEAALAEWVEQGYARLAMDRVARRAGVGKSALYRRWPSKIAMVVDLLADISVPHDPLASSGTLTGDVVLLLRTHLDWLRDPTISALLPDLLAESGRNPELAAAREEHIGEPRRAWARRFLREGTGTELSEPDLDLLLDLVAAPLFWRHVHGRAVDDEYLARLAETLVSGLAQRAPRSRSASPAGAGAAAPTSGVIRSRE